MCAVVDGGVRHPGPARVQAAGRRHAGHHYRAARGQHVQDVTSHPAVSVQYSTSAGSAVPTVDYAQIPSFPPSVLTFGANDTVKTFPVTVYNRPGYQGARTVNLAQTSSTPGLLVGSPSILTITGGAAPSPTVQFETTDTPAVSEGAGTATAYLTLAGSIGSNVVVT